ncbi:MAG: hypothetical protein ACF8NJ_01790 [Phycisphaerales bacterium JB038]
MQTSKPTQLGLTAVLALACAGAAWADEELLELPRTWEQLPQSVALTLEQALAGHEAEEIEEIIIEGAPVLYEAEYHLGGQEIEIAIYPNGDIAGRAQAFDDDGEDDAGPLEADDDDELHERDISFAELTDAARQTLSRILGGQQPDEIEEISYEGIVALYEVELLWSGEVDDDDDAEPGQPQRVEFFLYPDGSLAVQEGEVVERQVALADLPLTVADTLRLHSGGLALEEIEEVRCEGIPILYEAEYLVEGAEYEIAVFPNGLLARRGADEGEPDDGLREREIDLDDTPPAVAATIRHHFGEATLEIDEIAYEGIVVLYDAENGPVEISIYPDGELAVLLRDAGEDDDDDHGDVGDDHHGDDDD